MKKRYLWLIVAAVVLLSVGVGVTLAFLVAKPVTVENTFTVGNVEITLTETTGSTYKIIPGATLDKDPTITVLANSEDCWLFVKVEESSDFHMYCSYEIAQGWTLMEGEKGVYYRQVAKASADTAFSVLKDDCIRVFDTVTEERLNAMQTRPNLIFTGYAVQMEMLTTAEAAWDALHE